MTTTLRGITYEMFCGQGSKKADDLGREIAETRRIAYLLADAEEQHESQIPHYRGQLEAIKTRTHDASVHLQRHVAHCTDGCKRATHGASFAARAADQMDRAPHRLKPDLPGATELAALLQQGQSVEGLAAVYDRHPHTLRGRVTAAGYSATTGLPNHREPVEKPQPTGLGDVLQIPPWVDQALCAQTDPDSFFPEKGGSTREAKSVCTNCIVAAECLDYAIDNDERFGIWGGLSERERRRIRKALNANLDNQEAS